MKNPLAVFTGAALATLAALAGLNMTNWPGGVPDAQKPAEAAGQAQEPAETSGATPKPAETAGAAQKPATEETSPSPDKPTEMAAIPAPEPPKAETAAGTQPELDTVRVESDGQAIVAGRAKPGSEIALRLGNEVIGKGIASPDGSWVVVPDQPLPKGAHEITIEQKAADSAPVTAEQSIAVAIPEKPGEQAMVALTEPGTATKVLQAGGNQEQASLSEPQAEPAPSQPTAPAAAEKPAEPAQAAVQPPKADEPASTAQKPEEATPPAKPADQGMDVAKTEVFPEAVKPPETTAPAAPAPTKTAENIPLRLDAVDYNDKGDIIFSGRARPGTAVRLYVDNRPVGDAIVDTQGNWSFAGKDIIAPGTHNLRADQINTGGKVIARIELPFLRENAEAVAELNSPLQTEAVEAQPEDMEAQEPPQTSEPQPTAEQPKTTTAEQPKTTTAEQPKTTTAEQPKTTTAEQPKTATAEPSAVSEPSAQASASPKTSEPPQTTAEQQTTTEPQQPEASPPAPAKTAEAEPPQAAEVQKAEPEAAGPTADQTIAGDKKPEVTTTAAAEQAAKAIDPNQPRSGKVVIQPGNNLWKLSRVIYGRGKNYTVIYQANKDQIRNPGRIYPGQIFAIPGAAPPETIDPKRKDPLSSAEGGAAQ